MAPHPQPAEAEAAAVEVVEAVEVVPAEAEARRPHLHRQSLVLKSLRPQSYPQHHAVVPEAERDVVRHRHLQDNLLRPMRPQPSARLRLVASRTGLAMEQFPRASFLWRDEDLPR